MISSKKINKVCAVIPCFNEITTIEETIRKTSDYLDKVILVDDGSTDGLNKLKFSNKVIYCKHTKNLGKGAALKTGFLKSIELNFDITITLDADGQHDPSCIPKFIETMEKENNDCVIGRRQRDFKTMPPHRILSNYLTSKLLSLKTKLEILDSQSGYRAFRTKIIKNILPSYSGFEAESEMLVNLSRNNYILGHVEIPTIYGNDNSKMKAIDTIVGFLKVMLK
ncbi:MAG: hypothetical protein CR986_05000 [Ignavibacteriae bacterium]|nr:MAG: hypothetical protein CR986_05000 [Ignavibacteriota bacterium]